MLRVVLDDYRGVDTRQNLGRIDGVLLKFLVRMGRDHCITDSDKILHQSQVLLINLAAILVRLERRGNGSNRGAGDLYLHRHARRHL
jgi:hypothetical protein